MKEQPTESDTRIVVAAKLDLDTHAQLEELIKVYGGTKNSTIKALIRNAHRRLMDVLAA